LRNITTNPATTNKKHTRKKGMIYRSEEKRRKKNVVKRRRQPIMDTGKATTGPSTRNIATLWGARNIA
jgi:hypothetical protein